MGRAKVAEDSLGRVVGEYTDNLPQTGAMPLLSPQEVEQFVALGKRGEGLLRAGDEAGAEAAFRAQIAIFPGNPEPHVSLALLEAARGSSKAAIEHLRAAVIRGFTDLSRIERAEAWTRMRRSAAVDELRQTIPFLEEAERKWTDWSAFGVSRGPNDLATLLQGHNRLDSRIEAMAPALGPRLTRLWKTVVWRATAAMLEAYIVERPQAPDLEGALARLMVLYLGGPLQRWDLLPAGLAHRLGTVSNVAIQRFPRSAMRPDALVCRALARYAARDAKGGLAKQAADEIGASLEEVVTHHPESPHVAIATVGLIRTDAETGRLDRAAMRYRAFRDAHAADLALTQRVAQELGDLALRVGGVPEFQATTLDGASVGRDTLHGKVVVMDFWATWCPPCVEEFPTLRRIGERHGDEVVLLGVNMDRADDLTTQALREWVAREKVPGRHLHDGQSWESSLVKAFGVKEIPFSVVVGPDGAVLAVNEHGRRLEKTVRAAVEAARSVERPRAR